MRICPKIGPYYITRNNPRELLLQNKELKDEVTTYKAKLNMVKDLVMNSDKYDDSDFEGGVFQNDILDILRGDKSDR